MVKNRSPRVLDYLGVSACKRTKQLQSYCLGIAVVIDSFVMDGVDLKACACGKLANKPVASV